MNDETVIETRGDYRVRIVPDECADEPYNDGQSPLLRIEPRFEMRVTYVDTGASRPHQEDEFIIAAIQRWNTTPGRDNWNLFEKYLRAYFGVTQIETWYTDIYWYVTYDSAAWRKSIGFDGVIAPLDGGKGGASLAAYKAWCEGEVYSWVVEKRVAWRAVNPVTDDPDYAEYPDRETWETVESCSGYYGYDEYLKEEALEALTSAAGAPE